VKTAMLISIADGKTGRPVKDGLLLQIRIAKLGGAGGARTFLFEQDNISVQGGVAEFSYTFAESGLHELFLDFAFAANPDKIYEPPDFLMDVQKLEQSPAKGQNAFFGLIAVLFGFSIGWFLRGKLLS
jgi:hypothetical protein